MMNPLEQKAFCQKCCQENLDIYEKKKNSQKNYQRVET